MFVPVLTGVVWTWQGIPGDASATPTDPTAYTLTFDDAGSVAIRADCNQGNASYEVEGSGIALSPTTMTRVACSPGSLYDRYVQSLEQVLGKNV